MDTFPDHWEAWPVVDEGRLDLRKAIFSYLGTSERAIVIPRLSTRSPFYGKRSLRILNEDGKTTPGVYTVRDFEPGTYTISLYAKNPEEGTRRLGLFLAAEGRLYEVGRRWRNVVSSVRIPFHIREGEISLRDWSFSPGDMLIDHVVLLKLPFDMDYPRRVYLKEGVNRFVVDFSNVQAANLPVGINLEVRAPSGRVVRKNIEGILEQPDDQVAFELSPSGTGCYHLKLELYDLRTADVVFSDNGIVACYSISGHDSTKAGPRSGLSFFPVGIRLHAHEIRDLKGMGFNSVLIADPGIDDLRDYSKYLDDYKLKVFFEVYPGKKGEGCGEGLRALVEESRRAPGFSGWFLFLGAPADSTLSGEVREIIECLESSGPTRPVILENYLPDDHLTRVSGANELVAIDPNPVSIPTRPIFTVGLWADHLKDEGSGVQTVGMPQVFGGWPVAHRCPGIDEVRAMTYLALIHGAGGIVYRDFSSRRPYFNEADATWDIRKVPELWEEIPRLNGELAELSSFFTNGRRDAGGISTEERGYVDYGCWELGDRRLLIAVNVYGGDIDGKFQIDGAPSADPVVVLFEKRKVDWEGSGFSDHFEPFGTHVYSLPGD